MRVTREARLITFGTALARSSVPLPVPIVLRRASERRKSAAIMAFRHRSLCPIAGRGCAIWHSRVAYQATVSKNRDEEGYPGFCVDRARAPSASVHFPRLGSFQALTWLQQPHGKITEATPRVGVRGPV